MFKKFFGLTLMLLVIASNCFAMTFSQPVKIGGIGFPVQTPYRYHLVDGASYNSGTPYTEAPEFAKKRTTYKDGIAVFGSGENALYCQYKQAKASATSDDWRYALKFGGKNNYVIAIENQYKYIFKIDTDEGLTLYSIVRNSGSERINIIGRQKDGKWVSYIDSEILTKNFFGGNQAYKSTDGAHYSSPKFENDTIIIEYKYQVKYNITEEGEFRFKWDDKAQWFGIEQVVY